MVLNGQTNNGSTSVDTVQINPFYKTCESLKDFPLSTFATFATLLADNNTPIVCGGFSTNQCFLYDESSGWKETFPMTESRMFFTGMSGSPYKNASHKMYVLGYSNTAEVLTYSGWETVGPPTPKPFYNACLMVINATSVMVAGGYDGNNATASTYIFNTATNEWTLGPLLITARLGFACGLIQSSKADNTPLFIVAGGLIDNTNAVYSVELLDQQMDQWYLGRYL